jgi:hypothetical protein
MTRIITEFRTTVSIDDEGRLDINISMSPSGIIADLLDYLNRISNKDASQMPPPEETQPNDMSDETTTEPESGTVKDEPRSIKIPARRFDDDFKKCGRALAGNPSEWEVERMADTVCGDLTPENRHKKLSDVRRRLDWLVEYGYAEKVNKPGSRIKYRIIPGKRKDLLALVNGDGQAKTQHTSQKKPKERKPYTKTPEDVQNKNKEAIIDIALSAKADTILTIPYFVRQLKANGTPLTVGAVVNYMTSMSKSSDGVFEKLGSRETKDVRYRLRESTAYGSSSCGNSGVSMAAKSR